MPRGPHIELYHWERYEEFLVIPAHSHITEAQVFTVAKDSAATDLRTYTTCTLVKGWRRSIEDVWRHGSFPRAWMLMTGGIINDMRTLQAIRRMLTSRPNKTIEELAAKWLSKQEVRPVQ